MDDVEDCARQVCTYLGMHWLPVGRQVECKVARIMFKTLHMWLDTIHIPLSEEHQLVSDIIAAYAHPTPTHTIHMCCADVYNKKLSYRRDRATAA